MFVHTIDPVLFTLGPLEVRYYGLMYVLAFIIGYFLLVRLSKERELGLSKADVEAFLVWILVGGVVGARLVYVFVYNASFYLANPLQMLAVWSGGLSFHGGLLGALLAGWFFCKKHNVRFFALADIAMIPFAIGLGLGRIGNFLNAELVGRITNVPWAVEFNNEGVFRHPSQLYESAKNFVIFAVLWNLRKRSLPDGFLFWTFVMLYGLFRFVIEFFRAPDPQVGFVVAGLTMGQLLTFPMFILGVVMLLRLRKV